MKLNILICIILLGKIGTLSAQNNLHDFDRFAPKYPNELFLGAIMDAKSINENSYRFIDVPLNNITINYSFPVKSETLSPSRVTMMNAIKNALSKSNSLEQNYSFSHSTRELNSYNELALYMKQDIDKSFFFGVPNTPQTKNSIAVTEFTQSFFTVDMDMPDAGGLTPDEGSLDGYDKNQLIYINSINFGRKILVVSESEADITTLKSAINYMIKKAMGETVNADTQLESVFMNATIRIMIIGNESVEMSDVNNPFVGLMNYLNKKVNADDFGVPVSFTAAYLKNNGVFVNQITIK